MPRTGFVISFSVTGVAKTTRKLSRAEQTLDALMRQTLRELEPDILHIFRVNAVGGPRGRLAQGLQVSRIASTVQRPSFTVESTFRDRGYDPLGVTRFGHRTKLVRPRRDRDQATVLSTLGPRGPFPDKPGGRATQTALAFHDSKTGQLIFRHYVKGFDPPEDWVKTARLEAGEIVAEASTRLGRKIQSSLR